ncbi:MAG: hypothetical protein VB048_04725, partial [Bacteroidaceae bacterium]|nr:hypothetical protein [Bacteroidaceae bacterium]
MENNIITNENQDNDRKIKFDSLIDSIIKKKEKYKLNEFVRDIFSDKINTLREEGRIHSLLNKEKKEIFDIWSKCIIGCEDFFAIIDTIKRHCDNIGQDYIMALYYLYLKNQYHYYCQYNYQIAYYDYGIKEDYFFRRDLMNFLRQRIKDKYTGKINTIPDIEDDIANMFNILDNNMGGKNGYFDRSTAMEHNFTAFNNIHIVVIRKYNKYTNLLEDLIKGEIEKVNPQIINQTKENINFEHLIEKNKDCLTDIHTLADEKDVLNCTLIDFLQAIKNADFSTLNIKVKSKNKFLIYRLSIILDNKWYTQIC